MTKATSNTHNHAGGNDDCVPCAEMRERARTRRPVGYAGRDASPSSSTYCPNPDTCEWFPHCEHIQEVTS